MNGSGICCLHKFLYWLKENWNYIIFTSRVRNKRVCKRLQTFADVLQTFADAFANAFVNLKKNRPLKYNNKNFRFFVILANFPHENGTIFLNWG
jgi:hypothetical protein